MNGDSDIRWHPASEPVPENISDEWDVCNAILEVDGGEHLGAVVLVCDYQDYDNNEDGLPRGFYASSTTALHDEGERIHHYRKWALVW